ncbi:MAG: permease-like cell division protein FtsX [Mycobacteriales bacterium]
MRAGFVAREVWTGLRRNVTMTLAMILTTAISLVLLGAGILMAKQVDEMKNLYYSNVQVTIFLDQKITSVQKTTLVSELKSQPEIKNFSYETQDQAYKRFKKLFQQNPDIIKGTPKNYIPAAYHVELKNPERYKLVSKAFDGKPGVFKVTADAQVLDKLFTVLNGLRDGAIVVAIVQAVAALLLIANTIQIAAYTRRTETGIMRLVGASRWYVQFPFVVEAALAGLIGAVLAVGGLALTKVFFMDRTLRSLVNSGFLRPLHWHTIWAVTPILGGVGIVLGALAALLTLRLYVRL